ncbi:MAG: hypothetical protein EX266_06545 [Rhodobacteraceae bacterium]|nr:MAG: hypothetical protein EX266_06545 [Paracoccaceae bacterium]
MIPPVTTSAIAPKPATPQAPPTATKTQSPPAPDTARASIGEAAAGNVRAETARAIDAPEQSAVLPRLRDQETAEQDTRPAHDRDAPTGPPPSFDESPLERQKRVAFEPAPLSPDRAGTPSPDGEMEVANAPEEAAPPPDPRERAEVSFAETRAISEPREAPELDLSA